MIDSSITGTRIHTGLTAAIHCANQRNKFNIFFPHIPKHSPFNPPPLNIFNKI